MDAVRNRCVIQLCVVMHGDANEATGAYRECVGCQPGWYNGLIDNYRRVLPARSIVLKKVDIADHADQLAFVHDGHRTEFVERQKVSHLVKRCIR